MKTRLRNLSIELCNRRSYNKNELILRLIKSIVQNKNNQLKKKILFLKKLDSKSHNLTISKQRDFCLATGRAQGIINLLGLSRHSIKRAGLHNKLQNIKTRSW